jgi:UDPglucose 6-dehydrogenase
MELCEKSGADVDDLMDALALGNRRIVAASYMRAGMGDGGGCHPRDNIALSHIAKKLDISYDWWENLMIAREKQTQWLADLIIEEYYKQECSLEVMIMGYTFKPETNLTVGSPALLLKELLNIDGSIDENEIHMFDPFIDNIPTFIENDGTDPKYSLFKIYCEPRIFFIGTKHEQFKNYIFPSGSIVIDPFRYIPAQDGVYIKRIGQSKSKL